MATGVTAHLEGISFHTANLQHLMPPLDDNYLAGCSIRSGPALATAVASGLVVNWFFTPPLYTVTISEADNALALAAFVVVGVVTSVLVPLLG